MLIANLLYVQILIIKNIQSNTIRCHFNLWRREIERVWSSVLALLCTDQAFKLSPFVHRRTETAHPMSIKVKPRDGHAVCIHRVNPPTCPCPALHKILHQLASQDESLMPSTDSYTFGKVLITTVNYVQYIAAEGNAFHFMSFSADILLFFLFLICS